MVYVKFCVASSLINESFRDSIPHESAPVDSFTVQSFFAQNTSCQTHTDHATRDICINRPHLALGVGDAA